MNLTVETIRKLEEYLTPKRWPVAIVCQPRFYAALSGQDKQKLEPFRLLVFYDLQQEEEVIVFFDDETLRKYLNRNQENEANG